MAEPTEQVPELVNMEEAQNKLSTLRASATKEYALKNYSAAADYYSEATELQAVINGEMNPDNADLLYAYGRCLYHVAISNSDVLGGKVAAGEEPAKKKRKTTATSTLASVPETVAEQSKEDAAVAVDETQPAAAAAAAAAAPAPANKPFFQITGDENWTDSEDSADDGASEANGEQEDPPDEDDDDDFAIAYEILDVARLLLSRKLDALSLHHEGKGKAKATPPEDIPEARQVMERLADTHDLQAEISLENERFADAVSDEKASLDLKLRIYPQESSLVAEAHYKLSLALEFASVTAPHSEGEGEGEGEAPAEADATSQPVDEALRKESVSHMEAAIASCKLRVTKETQALASLSGDAAKEREKSIRDVKDMIADMETRLIDLRDPSLARNAANDGTGDAANPLGGLLGSILGDTPAQQKARIAEATKTANDLTGMIRHKKKPAVVAKDTGADTGAAAAAPETSSLATGKRKAEHVAGDGDGAEEVGNNKRSKIAEGATGVDAAAAPEV